MSAQPTPRCASTELGHGPTTAIPAQGWGSAATLGFIRDHLRHDVPPDRNLATFLSTSFDAETRQLYQDFLEHNLVDRDQYPGISELEENCLRIIADLWNADPRSAVGDATTGSSEAALLAGAAMLRNWLHHRGRGEPADRPNLVLGSDAHVCWRKFCRYWQVEPRVVPATPGRIGLTPDSAAQECDENTIGVVAILGSTIDGTYDPVHDIAAALDAVAQRRGIDVPLHVDAASGGFIAPFLDPELPWDFRVPRVRSINASGHKYGLVPPGLGWVLWRDQGARTGWLHFDTNYLGRTRTHHELSFSRSAAPVVVQFYNFLRLGFDGFRHKHRATRDKAMHLARELRATHAFELLGDGSQLPVLALTPRDGSKLHELSLHLAERGWSVPVYTLPPDLEETEVLRVVVREDMTWDDVEAFVRAVREFTGVVR
ncbi:glutamate decarboxylase [Salinifilum ghardaiensis]